jgi:hypothetical protein
MNEIVKLLDKNLDYKSHEIIDDTIYIHVVSNQNEIVCTYCGIKSNRVHSHYSRSFQDLPLMGKKVIIVISNRKMFCDNANCSHTTFAESFSFLSYKAKKTNRLKEEIIQVALTQSSISASQYLKSSVANVKKSTICNYLKKMRTSYE